MHERLTLASLLRPLFADCKWGWGYHNGHKECRRAFCHSPHAACAPWTCAAWCSCCLGGGVGWLPCDGFSQGEAHLSAVAGLAPAAPRRDWPCPCVRVRRLRTPLRPLHGQLQDMHPCALTPPPPLRGPRQTVHEAGDRPVATGRLWALRRPPMPCTHACLQIPKFGTVSEGAGWQHRRMGLMAWQTGIMLWPAPASVLPVAGLTVTPQLTACRVLQQLLLGQQQEVLPAPPPRTRPQAQRCPRPHHRPRGTACLSWLDYRNCTDALRRCMSA